MMTWRRAALLGGIAAIWLAVASPLAPLDHHLLTAHMAHHLILMIAAAPLLLLSAPPRFARVSIHPAFCWFAGTLTVLAWHVPAIFALAHASPIVHQLEQVSFLIAGLLFWWPVVQPVIQREPGENRWSIPLYLFLATLPCDALSAFLVFSGRIVYRPYFSTPGALEDQSRAGAFMWVTVTFAYLVPAILVTLHILSLDTEPGASPNG